MLLSGLLYICLLLEEHISPALACKQGLRNPFEVELVFVMAPPAGPIAS